MSDKASEVRAWYNKLYAAVGLASTRPKEAYPQILDLLDARGGASLLDVSCGQGFLLKAAEQRGLAAAGVDISDQAVRLAHQVAPRSRVAVASGESLCFRDATFEYVTCLGSLEHFLDMGQGLREMRRVAKPGALFCIMVPNAHFIGWRLLGRRGTAQQDINEQLQSLESWRRLFTEHGLDVVRVLPDRWHAEKWRHGQARGPFGRVRGMLLEAAWRAIPLRYEYQFIFLLRQHSNAEQGIGARQQGRATD
jgi:SAM-dependent methyltransferase